jgi:glycosyltransferase domain-containing protein
MKLEEVTIIIPTHNRNFLLKRAIEYYLNFNCNIIICDSSENKSIEILNNSKLTYLHNLNTTFAKKLYNAITYVKTKYVCLSSDDDFLSLKGVHKGVSFLENNDDYYSVQGRYVQFYSNKNNFTTVNLYDAAGLIHYDSDSPFQRALDSSKNGMQLLYALHRTEGLLNSLKVSEICKPLTMVEYTSNLVPLLYGKHKMLNVFWMARDPKRYTSYESTSNSLNTVVYPLDLITYFNTNNGIEFTNIFLQKCIELTNSNTKEAEKLFYEIFFENYIHNHIKYILNKKNITYSIKIKNFIKQYLLTLKFLYNKIFTHQTKNEFPFKEYEDDWTLIKNIVIKYKPQVENFEI